MPRSPVPAKACLFHQVLHLKRSFLIFFPLQTCELLGKQCPKVGEKLQGSVVPELEGMGEAAKLNCLGLVTEAAINI